MEYNGQVRRGRYDACMWFTRMAYRVDGLGVEVSEGAMRGKGLSIDNEVHQGYISVPLRTQSRAKNK